MMIHSLYSLILFIMVFLAWGCQGQEPKQPVEVKAAEVSVLPESKTLAEIAPDEGPDIAGGNSEHASGTAPEGYFVIAMHPQGRGMAYIARTAAGVHVVHNGTRGRDYEEVDGTTLRLSRDGNRVAYGAATGGKWYVVVDGQEYGPYEDKGPPVFSPDGKHVGFEGQQEGVWRMHCDGAESSEAPYYFDAPVFSGDSERILRLENSADETSIRLVFSDLEFRPLAEHSFESGMSYVADPTGKRIVVIIGDKGRFRLNHIYFTDPGKVIPGPVYDTVSHVVFSSDGERLAFIAKRDGKDLLVVDGKEEAIPAGEYWWPPVFATDGSVGVIIFRESGAYAHRAFGGEPIPVPGKYKECADLVFGPEGRGHAYVAIKDEQFLIVSNGVEGPVYDRVISPQFSPDGRFLVYRARQEGRRFVVVADPKTGKVIREHPRYDRVFETTFTEDGKSVAYGAKDGKEIMWKVEGLP